MLYFYVEILHILNFCTRKYEDYISVAYLLTYSGPSALKKIYILKIFRIKFNILLRLLCVCETTSSILTWKIYRSTLTFVDHSLHTGRWGKGGWLRGWLDKWLCGLVVECLRGWVIVWLSGWGVDCLSDWGVEWLSGWGVEWLSG